MPVRAFFVHFIVATTRVLECTATISCHEGPGIAALPAAAAAPPVDSSVRTLHTCSGCIVGVHVWMHRDG
jgi:hypothetical protein